MPQRFGHCGGGGIAFADHQRRRGRERIHATDDREASFLAAVLGEALGAVLLDVLHGPLLAVGVVGRDVGFLALLVGKDAGVHL